MRKAIIPEYLRKIYEYGTNYKKRTLGLGFARESISL